MKKKSASQSAFFKLRLLLGVLLCFTGVTIVLLGQPRTPSSQSTNSHPIVQAQFRGVLPVVKFDISPPLRDMKPLPAKECTLRENEDRDILAHLAPLGPVVPDPVVQRVLGKIGIPAANNTLWSGFGGPCQTENAGDPVVLYDQLADRWLLSQFTSAGPNYFECVAVSQTSDPTGTFFRYAISTGTNFPDYPKAGMWPDAYYFSTREFDPIGNFAGAGAYALDRPQVLAGNPNPTIV